MKAMTIDQMVTEDQRNMATRALKGIISSTDAVVNLADTEEAESMSAEDLFNLLVGTIAVIRFNAHSVLESIEKMEIMR